MKTNPVSKSIANAQRLPQQIFVDRTQGRQIIYLGPETHPLSGELVRLHLYIFFLVNEMHKGG